MGQWVGEVSTAVLGKYWEPAAKVVVKQGGERWSVLCVWLTL